MKQLLINILTMICIYLTGCFIAWDFNPANWELYGRIFLVIYYIAVLIAMNHSNSKK